MGRIIVKQPNGLFCLYSTIVDNVTHLNMNRQDLIDMWVIMAIDNIIAYINSEIIDSDNKTHMSFEQIISNIEKRYGKDEVDKIYKELKE